MVTLIIIIILLVSLLVSGVYYHHMTIEGMRSTPKAPPSIETVCILCDRHGREMSRRSFADGRLAPQTMQRHSQGTVMHYTYVATNDRGEHLYQLDKA